MCADVEVGDRLCAAACCVEREAAGEAERVEHVATGAERFHAPTILALVKEEPGFLPFHDVGLEAQAGFEECNDGGLSRRERKRRRMVWLRGNVRKATLCQAKSFIREKLDVPAQAEHQMLR